MAKEKMICNQANSNGMCYGCAASKPHEEKQKLICPIGKNVTAINFDDSDIDPDYYGEGPSYD